MARLARAEIFDPSEIVPVHLIGKTVRSLLISFLGGITIAIRTQEGVSDTTW